MASGVGVSCFPNTSVVMPSVGAFTRLQLLDGLPESLDGDVRWPRTQREIALPFRDAFCLLFFVTLFLSKLVDSRVIIVELFRSVSVGSRSAYCDVLRVGISCGIRRPPVRQNM